MPLRYLIWIVCCFLIPSPLYGQDIDKNVEIRAQVQKPWKPLGRAASKLGNKVTVVFQDSRHDYWFAGGREGVYRYDGNNLILYSSRDGLCSHAVVGIQEDEKRNVYFDTTDGISRFDGKTFQTLQPTISETASKGWELKPSDLWFRMGWDKDGPYRFDGKNLYQLEFPKIERAVEFRAKFPNADWSPYGLYTLYRDSKGVVWFGTAALGVCRYDGQSISWLYEQHLTETPSGGDFGIRSIIEDKDGFFWFCNSRFRYEIVAEIAAGAPIEYRTKAGVAVSGKNGEPEFPYFMSIESDDDGDLWMATYDDGVWHYDGEKLIQYPVKVGKENVLLFSIYKDLAGTLWLGSHENGVFKFNGSEFEKFLSGE